MSVLKKKVTLAIIGNKVHRLTALRRQQQQILEQPLRVENAVNNQQGNNLGQQRELNVGQNVQIRANNLLLSQRTIMKNYSRAIFNFAISTVALSSLDGIFSAHQINGQNFREFVTNRDLNLDSITNLRNLLFVRRADSQEIMNIKRVFKEMCMIFLKTFSLNWILQSKIENKGAHIKYRSKMIRRVNNPRLFAQL